MHAHELHEVYYFISGQGSFSVEGTTYPLTPGCIMIMRPGETHRLQISPDHPYERAAIHFSTSFLAAADPGQWLLEPFYRRNLGQFNLYNAEKAAAGVIANCMNGLLGSLPAEKEQDAYQIELTVLSHLLPVLCELRRCHGVFSEKEPDFQANDLISQVVYFINTNLSEDWDLDTLSSKFFLSKSYLNSQFRQATGSTIWEYTIIKRLMAARERIRSGTPVSKVFHESGFHDYSAFYRRYKERFGVAPSQDKPD